MSATAKPNRIAGTWQIRNATSTTGGTNITLPFGPVPQGLQIFTPQLTFAEEFNAALLPSDASAPTLANSGVYTVDANGVFLNETVLGSTRGEFIGRVNDRSVLNLTVVDGERVLITDFIPSEGTFIRIVSERAT